MQCRCLTGCGWLRQLQPHDGLMEALMQAVRVANGPYSIAISACKEMH